MSRGLTLALCHSSSSGSVQSATLTLSSARSLPYRRTGPGGREAWITRFLPASQPEQLGSSRACWCPSAASCSRWRPRTMKTARTPDSYRAVGSIGCRKQRCHPAMPDGEVCWATGGCSTRSRTSCPARASAAAASTLHTTFGRLSRWPQSSHDALPSGHEQHWSCSPGSRPEKFDLTASLARRRPADATKSATEP